MISIETLSDGQRLRRIIDPLPALDLRHLAALSDSTGVLQHARYCVADRSHGYCTDDNARALIVACRAARLGVTDPGVSVATYLAFLTHAFNAANGRFRNFMTYERSWLEETGSEDSHGRALWGLGVAAACAPRRGERDLAMGLLADGMVTVELLSSPRAWAYAVLGIGACFAHRPVPDDMARRARALSYRLDALFASNGEAGWFWCEQYLTYDNAILPLSLVVAGSCLGDSRLLGTGLRSLGWLMSMMIAPQGHLTLIGSDGWLIRGAERATFDQQPVDAAALALACAAAYQATGDAIWLGHLRLCMDWFMGRNDTGAGLYDPETGGCFDGLAREGVNANLGAESTLAWLMARCCMQELEAV